MREIESRTEPIGFGKFKNLSVKELAEERPGYFCWLSRENVIKFKEKKDQRWFKRRAKTISEQMEAWKAALIPNRILDDFQFEFLEDI
jgi:hypothetical protein